MPQRNYGLLAVGVSACFVLKQNNSIHGAMSLLSKHENIHRWFLSSQVLYRGFIAQ